MKAINNLQNLVDILNKEDINWQRTIYNKTGVLIHINKYGGILLSNCGYINLDLDAEYVFSHGKDETQYTSIKSIQQLIDYILKMDSYYDFLEDRSLGQFTKSELFWSIQNQIILAEENQRREDGSLYQDWGLFRISTYNHRIPPFDKYVEEEFIVLDMALVNFNSAELEIPRRTDLALSDALRMVITQMNQTTEDIFDIPYYRVCSDIPVSIPNSYDELEETIQTDGIFSWLR